MDLGKWIYNQMREVILEDFRYQYDKESFLPPPSVLDQVAKAYQYIQKNNLVSGTGGNEGSGLQKATALLKKEPLTHAQLKRMKAFFDNNYEAVQREKGLGKDITNSGLLQSWELWGGDYGREWVNNRINSVQNKNDRSKNLRPKGHKRMMDPTNTRVHDSNKLYVSESLNNLTEDLTQNKLNNFEILYDGA